MDVPGTAQTKRNRKGVPARRVPVEDVPPAKLINGYMTFVDLYTWCAERLTEPGVLAYLTTWRLSFASDLQRFPADIVRCVNAVLQHTQSGLYVAPSRIKNAGYGLFTSRRRLAAEDAPFAPYGGIRMSDDYYLLHNRNGAYLVQAGDGSFIDGELRFALGEPARWANTTASPQYHNVVLTSPPGSSQVMLQVTRDIESNSEIYCDYGAHYEMEGGGGAIADPEEPLQFDLRLECSVCGVPNVTQRCTQCHDPLCTRRCLGLHAAVH